MKLKLANLNHDVSSLISAFINSKKTGKFDLKNVTLKEVPAERLNLLLSSDESFTKRVHFADSSASDYTKADVQHRDEIINSLQLELKSYRNQYESLLNGVILSFL